MFNGGGIYVFVYKAKEIVNNSELSKGYCKLYISFGGNLFTTLPMVGFILVWLCHSLNHHFNAWWVILSPTCSVFHMAHPESELQRKFLVFSYFTPLVAFPLFTVLSSPLPLLTYFPPNCPYKHTNTIQYLLSLFCFKLISYCHLLSPFPTVTHLCPLGSQETIPPFLIPPGKGGEKLTMCQSLPFPDMIS